MNRKEQINERFKLFNIESDGQAHYYSFLSGAEWADNNPNYAKCDTQIFDLLLENSELKEKLLTCDRIINDLYIKIKVLLDEKS